MTDKRRTSRGAKKKQQEPTSVQNTPGGEIVLYQAPDGTVSLDVRLDRETIWLNLNQLAALFERDKSVISRHLRNIFREGELEREATVAFFATAQKEGNRWVTRRVEHFNLDAIISVGYRVNSKRGTQFRIWATQVLRDHILKGYTVNARRLEELQKTIRLVARVAGRRELSGDEAKALIRVVNEYSFALDLLDDVDHGRLPEPGQGTVETRGIEYEEARRMIAVMRDQFGAGPLFGQEKDEGLKSALGAVFQTVQGCDAYSSLEKKAAHLLYFVVKNHAFVDGNKRIGAALFLWFLEKNGALYREDGERRISEEALVALTLLIAESPPQDKELIVRLVTCLLQGASSTRRNET